MLKKFFFTLLLGIFHSSNPTWAHGHMVGPIAKVQLAKARSPLIKRPVKALTGKKTTMPLKVNKAYSTSFTAVCEFQVWQAFIAPTWVSGADMLVFTHISSCSTWRAPGSEPAIHQREKLTSATLGKHHLHCRLVTGLSGSARSTFQPISSHIPLSKKP